MEKKPKDLSEDEKMIAADKSIKNLVENLLVNHSGADEQMKDIKTRILKDALENFKLGEYQDTNSENRKRIFYFLQESGETLLENILNDLVK